MNMKSRDSDSSSLTQLRAFLRPQGTTGLGDMIHVVSIICWTSNIAVYVYLQTIIITKGEIFNHWTYQLMLCFLSYESSLA